VSQRLIPTGERSGLLTRIAAIRSDDLFKMLTEEKIGIFQDVTVIRHDKKLICGLHRWKRGCAHDVGSI
jgi:hypothetical protein